eukprot:CAMPEP_0181189710 /NCGR_PEP_ID=MMETSP1096-20121128/11804_1 /TAXON_ID=156174 ORGANISM="Chrysochromulina ericina, Strain CCMP281" /NCGR_SAMPLE_ID=MMETSP1096 /ASSEMBLY_ACC=CAM_ASM_000453 /LENGTH=71 /DNA_ID=CAMNT_0023278875 /DNA_START=169 /DNA_END=380 /DNA_ORIENTATION=-
MSSPKYHGGMVSAPKYHSIEPMRPVPPAASEANAHQPAEQRKQACHHVRPTANPMASMRAEAPNMEKVAAG